MTDYCEHCGQTIKEFRIPLSKNNIKILLIINKLSKEKDYITTKEIYQISSHGSPTAELTRLKYLGAIEKVEEKGKRRSGKWIISEQGKAFLEKKGTLPRYAIIRNQEVIEFGEEVMMDDPSLKWQTESDIWKLIIGGTNEVR